MTSVLTADRRLGPYVVLAVGGLVGAVVTGQVALAAVAAPAALFVVRALADRRPLAVRIRDVEAPDRLLEGDRWELIVELGWVGDAELDILHIGLRGSRVEDVEGWTVRRTDGVTLTLTAVATRWGIHDLGTLVVRARRPGGMLRWDVELPLPGSIRVLPAARRLDELLRPTRPRVAAGGHVSPARGTGSDFADLRPYVPGDRLRDVSWAASARSDVPWVVVHHPERTATVVLLLDGFVEVGAPTGALDRAARVAWGIARQHLAAGDRVGLLAEGTASTWLSPTSGRRARWQLLDALLSVGSSVAGSGRHAPSVGRPSPPLPSDAVVVGVSPLQSDGFIAAAVHHVRCGRPTVVVGIEIADLLEPAGDDVERAARRLWSAEVDGRIERLGSIGVPAVRIVDDPRPAVKLLNDRLGRPRRVVA